MVLSHHQHSVPNDLPLGIRQRLSLATHGHRPEALILDEHFWRRSSCEITAVTYFFGAKDGVTIFISTHFMNEAVRCDRISLMHAGEVLVTDTQAIKASKSADTLEQAFIDYLAEAQTPENQTQNTEQSAPEGVSADNAMPPINEQKAYGDC